MARRIALFMGLILAACAPPPAPLPLPSNHVVRPGVRYALPTELTFGALGWEVTEGCGQVVSGIYTTPDCAALPLTCTIVARFESARSNSMTLSVEDAVKDVFACGIDVATQTCNPTITVGPAETVQLYARVRTYCAGEWSPPLPIGVTCPLCPP